MKKSRTNEFVQSLLQPVKTDLEYRRIVATADEARAFYLEYPRAGEVETVELRFGVQKDAAQRDESAQGLRVIVDVAAIEMMHAWVRQRSEGFTLEVQGRFLAKRCPEGLHVDDFVPLPSFCQSLAYETTGPEDRQQRFGQARMRTISMDDWKPTQTQFYTNLGIFAEAGEIPIDPFKVPIPFHSHYLRSHYQGGPSPGDFDRIYHLKWLYAPGSGRNILYSGVLPLQVDVPHRFEPMVASDDARAPGPLNADDCQLVIEDGPRAGKVFALPLEGALTLGRHDDCDVQLADVHVSRLHARLYFTAAGQLALEDLSAAGTFIEGERLHGATSIIERPTTVVIGETTLRISF